jgi:hypothetical protein
MNLISWTSVVKNMTGNTTESGLPAWPVFRLVSQEWLLVKVVAENYMTRRTVRSQGRGLRKRVPMQRFHGKERRWA